MGHRGAHLLVATSKSFLRRSHGDGIQLRKMDSDAKQYPKVILPATAKARPSLGWSPQNVSNLSPQVLLTVQDHIRFRHNRLQPQDLFFVPDPDMVCQRVYRWRQLLPAVEAYYGKKAPWLWSSH